MAMERTRRNLIKGFVFIGAFLWLLPAVGKAQAASPPLPPSNAASNEAPNVTRGVNCDTGQTIQEAVDTSNNGDTVLVSGTCFENVTVGTSRTTVTLDGQGAATISGPDATLDTIDIRGRGITIRGFSITGGRDGIRVFRGATAANIDGNSIQSTGRNGINVFRNS